MQITVGGSVSGVARLLALALCLSAAPAMAESRTYAVAVFSQAMASADDDCAQGINPAWDQQRLKNLATLGYTEAQINEMLQKELAGAGGGQIDNLMATRGRLEGQPVNALAYPATVTDPKLHALTGKYGYGFNLDGKTQVEAFEDPQTHEQGVDHALARALGCVRVFRGTLASPATYWTYIWAQLKDSQPALLITLSGEDLSKDGDVTITIDRAREHLRSNSDGSPRSDATYRIDSDPRSHNVFQGVSRGGVITLKDPGSTGIHFLLNPLLLPELRMNKVQMRLKVRPDGSLETMIGGYQPWGDIYWTFGAGGPGGEVCVYGDVPGLYYLLKKYADAEPDPTTGLNTAISAAYYMEAVPAFAVQDSPAAANAGTRVR